MTLKSLREVIKMYKETIHDGSVSYSVIRSDPEPGKGAHYKEPSTLQQYSRALY